MRNKLRDIFSRQDDEVEEQPKAVKKQLFNEAYFDCKLIYYAHKMSLIKVQANIAVGPDAGTPMVVSCRWFLKSQNKFSEIKDVKNTCYQPCIDDVGYCICVQIDPKIEGRTYTGATIIKQTQAIQLGAALQSAFTQIKNKLYHFNQNKQFRVRIDSVQKCRQIQGGPQLPVEINLIVKRKQGEQDIFVAQFQEPLPMKYLIGKDYPKVTFIRNSFNTILWSASPQEEIRITFPNTTDRDIFGLLIRTLSATSCISGYEQMNLEYQHKESIKQEKQEKQESEHQATMSTLNAFPQGKDSQSLPEVVEELKKLRKQHSELISKYNNERQKKIKLQNLLQSQNKDRNELDSLRKENTSVKQKIELIDSDCRFYQNQLAIVRKQLRDCQEEKIKLSGWLEQTNNLLTQSQKKLAPATIKPEQIESLEEALHKQTVEKEQALEMNEILKGQVQKLENQLKKVKKKIESLAQERVIQPIKPIIYEKSTVIESDSKQKNEKIQTLELKILNLEMLLKHRMVEPGNQSMTFQKVINNLTQNITQKQLQLQSMKKVNKQLVEKIYQLSQ